MIFLHTSTNLKRFFESHTNDYRISHELLKKKKKIKVKLWVHCLGHKFLTGRVIFSLKWLKKKNVRGGLKKQGKYSRFQKLHSWHLEKRKKKQLGYYYYHVKQSQEQVGTKQTSRYNLIGDQDSVELRSMQYYTQFVIISPNLS